MAFRAAAAAVGTAAVDSSPNIILNHISSHQIGTAAFLRYILAARSFSLSLSISLRDSLKLKWVRLNLHAFLQIALRKDPECVKVVVRCRPMSRKEVEDNRQRIVEIDKKTGEVNLDTAELDLALLNIYAGYITQSRGG